MDVQLHRRLVVDEDPHAYPCQTALVTDSNVVWWNVIGFWQKLHSAGDTITKTHWINWCRLLLRRSGTDPNHYHLNPHAPLHWYKYVLQTSAFCMYWDLLAVCRLPAPICEQLAPGVGVDLALCALSHSLLSMLTFAIGVIYLSHSILLIC